MIWQEVQKDEERGQVSFDLWGEGKKIDELKDELVPPEFHR